MNTNNTIKINKNEIIIKEMYESKGFKTLRRGQPDFLFYKENKKGFKDIIFVEVKGYLDKMNRYQKKYKEILEFLGAKYIIEKPTTDKEKKVIEFNYDNWTEFRIFCLNNHTNPEIFCEKIVMEYINTNKKGKKK